MAFVRSWAEGLDPVVAWSRYLFVDGHCDARRARGELQRLLDRLRGMARAHGRPEIAALLRRDPEAMADHGPQAPTLEAFAASQPPDYYSEAELVALYQEQFGRADARSAARRRQRLRQRLVGAIQWLEQLDARAPHPADPVAAWLPEQVAGRLAAVGIHRLDALCARIGQHGAHWHRGIPRLGPVGAARIVRWIGENGAALGALPVPAPSRPARPDAGGRTAVPGVALVPLDDFTPPADRDGSRGTNRAAPGQCRIAATDDRQAIQAWLAGRPAGSHTWRAYRKEAERFMLWAVVARGKPLSSLTGEDCRAYRAFLAAPGPAWTGPRHAPRGSAGWRPFEGPLSARSQAMAVTVLRGLCDWLVRARYLAGNPWRDGADGEGSPVSGAAAAPADAPPALRLRALSEHEWRQVQDWLAQARSRAPSPALHRLGWLLEFGYLSGLRLGELAAARLGWLRREVRANGDEAWSLRVPGQGDRCRVLPLSEAAIGAVRSALALRGLDPDPLAHRPETPLVARLDTQAPLSAARIYEILADGFRQCAQALAERDPAAAARIRAASTRWLRHSHGLHATVRGVPLDALRLQLGHRSLASTAVYAEAAAAFDAGSAAGLRLRVRGSTDG